MSELIRIDHDGDGITTVTMTNPTRRNALSQEMLETLLGAFREIAKSDAVGVILTAEGPIFSAGHDFADMHGRGVGEMRQLLELCAELMLFLQSMPQIVLARVHAPAVAAGFQLMSSCDLVVVVDSASFWAPGGKGGWFCHTPMVAVGHQVSRKRAAEIGFTGDPIDAATALDWGLVNRVVPEAELDEACRDLLGRATRGSRDSKAMGKQTLYRQLDLPMREAYNLATEVMALSSQTPAGREAIASFVERRKPDFDGT